jgi:L-fuconolactonase
MLRESLAPAFKAMVEHGLVFDALVKPPHLPALLVLARRYPDLTIVLDHGAKPPIMTDDLKAWKRGITALARNTRMVCKLSGLVTEAGSVHPEALRESVKHLLAEFGPSRLMWGSDWPVCELVCSYDDWLGASDQLLEELGESERQAILSETAKNTYGI